MRLCSAAREDELVLAVLPCLPRALAGAPPAWPDARPAGAEADPARQPGMVDFQVERKDAAIRMGAGGWEGLPSRRCSPTSCWQWRRPAFNGVAAHAARDSGLPADPLGGRLGPLAERRRPAHPDLEWADVHRPNLRSKPCAKARPLPLTRRSLAHDLLQSGELATGRTDCPYANPYWLVWPSRSRGKAKVQVFAEWLEGEIADYLGDWRRLPSNR